MSRPKAWNGTQWVDPAFHIGGNQFKTYIPPAYDVPVGQYTFDSGPEGWINYDAADGGNIRAQTPGGWLANTVNMAGPNVKDQAKPFKPGVTIRCRFLWQTEPAVVGYADNRNLRLYFYERNHEIYLPNASNPAQWTTHSFTITTDEINSNYYGDLTARIELWGTNDDQVALYLHECRMEDANTGQPLYKLGDPGWEPKVKRSDGTWK